jgi:hypothetical protein
MAWQAGGDIDQQVVMSQTVGPFRPQWSYKELATPTGLDSQAFFCHLSF